MCARECDTLVLWRDLTLRKHKPAREFYCEKCAARPELRTSRAYANSRQGLAMCLGEELLPDGCIIVVLRAQEYRNGSVDLLHAPADKVIDRTRWAGRSQCENVVPYQERCLLGDDEECKLILNAKPIVPNLIEKKTQEREVG